MKFSHSLRLSEQVIHIWSIDLDGAEQYKPYCWTLLSQGERDRAERFRFTHLKDSFAASRAILRILAGGYLGVAPRDLRFAYGQKGKPSIDLANNSLDFNLSHAGSLAVYGFALSCALGVDIEAIHSMPDRDAVAHRFFSPGEQDNLGRIPEELRTEAFFRCWTRKEAFIKAVGEGLSFPLEHFQVSVSTDENPRLIQIMGDSVEASNWSMHHLSPTPGYIGAVAYRGHERQVQCFHLPALPALEPCPGRQ